MAGRDRGILVGYDGSPGSRSALTWAAREARDRRAVLTVCHAWVRHPAGRRDGAGPDGEVWRAAERILAEGVRLAGSCDVRPLLAEGPAARILCEHSADADQVVVGSRGAGGIPAVPIGSVGLQVAACVPGPVVVVRGHWRPAGAYLPGPVAAGIDGSAAAGAVLAFAGEEAALRSAPLVTVCALSDAPASLGAARGIEDAFTETVARWEKEHPGAAAQRRVTVMSPRTALLAAAEDAQLLVVGCRGRGGIRGMALGSVSHALICHAPCPVAVIHVH